LNDVLKTILKNIQNKLAEETAKAQSKYDGFEKEDLLNLEAYENKETALIRNGRVYKEVDLTKHSITTILGYLFGYTNLVYVPEQDKLYEMIYPANIKKMHIGTEAHEGTENFVAENFDDFAIEEFLSYQDEFGDEVNGKLDLAYFDKNNNNLFIIDLKTGKELNKEYLDFQLKSYAFLFCLKHKISPVKIIGIGLGTKDVYEISFNLKTAEQKFYDLLEAKNQMIKELEEKKLLEATKQNPQVLDGISNHWKQLIIVY